MAEPRVLRSDKGTVAVLREVRYEVRIKKLGATGERALRDPGTLTQRVPAEHLVPVGTDRPGLSRVLAPATAYVSVADSLAPLAVAERGATHQGGGGLFDAVASVLHPDVTAPGAPGRGGVPRDAGMVHLTPPALVPGAVPCCGESLHGRHHQRRAHEWSA
ncbi:hypothetical protein [Streptomyces katrae]|uniref:Uncharacterized protein n=1 Tax=Streptomyces katrae TaxID=68223 RepID=A0A0F4IT42_9ACTN|nr:hypothetical protein [Streptomyces katrae]KJY24633.1 hypothetical protein VR44_34770 [Streptomyces katrae]